jgi:hypothetical protein
MLKKKNIIIGVALLLAVSFYLFHQKALDLLVQVPDSIEIKETVETSLKSHLFEISGSKKIILATLKQFEIFERKSELSLFHERLKLPDIVVSASMPVEYNYFVEFNNAWVITTDERSITVIAPKLEALKPGVSVSEIEFGVVKGSLFRRDSLVTEELRQELDQLLQESSLKHMSSVQEVARVELREIIQLWMQSQDLNLEIKVFFESERESTLL